MCQEASHDGHNSEVCVLGSETNFYFFIFQKIILLLFIKNLENARACVNRMGKGRFTRRVDATQNVSQMAIVG